MIGYIFLIVLTIVAWFLFCFGVKHEIGWQSIVGFFSSLVCTVLFLVSSIYLSTKASDAENFKNDRDYCQELVNAVPDNMSPATITRIIASAESVNHRIEKNRRHCNSEMWGFMCNKGIAEVEPVDIPKYKISVEIVE